MQRLVSSMKIIGHAVLLFMLVAVIYAAYMSVKNWSGISV